jgi:hypothetical protein
MNRQTALTVAVVILFLVGVVWAITYLVGVYGQA